MQERDKKIKTWIWAKWETRDRGRKITEEGNIGKKKKKKDRAKS